MYQGASRAKCSAVGPRLERGVRRHCPRKRRNSSHSVPTWKMCRPVTSLKTSSVSPDVILVAREKGSTTGHLGRVDVLRIRSTVWSYHCENLDEETPSSSPVVITHGRKKLVGSHLVVGAIRGLVAVPQIRRDSSSAHTSRRVLVLELVKNDGTSGLEVPQAPIVAAGIAVDADW
jgi:hypothetical protein